MSGDPVYKELSSLETQETDKPSQSGIRQVISSFADRTSCQGIPFIRNSLHWYTKLVWVCVFVAALSAWIFHTYYLMDVYFRRGTTSQVTIGYDTLDFPSVTLCNINPIRRKHLTDYGSQELIDFLNSLEPPTSLIEQPTQAPPPDGSGSNQPRPDQIQTPGRKKRQAGPGTAQGPQVGPVQGPTVQRPTQGTVQRQTQGPVQGPTQGPVQEPTQGPVQESTRDTMQRPTQGPVQGPNQGPVQGSTQGPVQGPTQGPVQGPVQGSNQGPVQGPNQGPVQGPTQGAVQGPNQGPTQESVQGPNQGQTQGAVQRSTQGAVQESTQRPLQGPTQGPVQGLNQESTQEPVQGPNQGPTQGAVQRLTQAAVQGTTQRPVQGPTQGPSQGPTQRSIQGPTQITVQGPNQGPTLGSQNPAPSPSTTPFRIYPAPSPRTTPFRIYPAPSPRTTPFHNRAPSPPPKPTLPSRYENLPPRDTAIYGGGNTSLNFYNEDTFLQLYGDISLENRTAMGYSASNMILECSFNGYECSYENFTLSPNLDYGNCYTFNPASDRTESLKSSRSGAIYGLNLLLYLEEHEYIPGLRGGRGLRMDIHGFQTLSNVKESGISISPGFHSYAGMKMINSTRLGGVYGECGDGDQFTKFFGSRYTKESCINTCLDRTIHEKCNCSTLNIRSKHGNQSHGDCSQGSSETIVCSKYYTALFEVGELNCSCNSACLNVEYDILMSYNSWPTETLFYQISQLVCNVNGSGPECSYIRRATQNMTTALERQAFVAKNFLRLSLFYRDLNFQQVTEQPEYEDSQFISDLGGCIGLWVGASAITMIELLDFLVHCCTYCCKDKPKNMKQRKKDNNNGDDHHNQNRDYYDYHNRNRDYYHGHQRYSDPEYNLQKRMVYKL